MFWCFLRCPNSLYRSTPIDPAPRRFEIHSVDPPVGSEEGGSRVTVRGVGFGNKQLTPQVGRSPRGGREDGRWKELEGTGETPSGMGGSGMS